MVAVLALATACGNHGAKHGGGSGGDAGSSKQQQGPQITITPTDGQKKAEPDKGIVVTVSGGTLSIVTVTDHGKPVPGTFSADKSSWKSTWPLTPGDSYQASATAASGGKTNTANSSFTALMPQHGVQITQVTPARGATVGVGMPVTVLFNRAVTDKAAVERTFQITAEKPVEGAWNWVSSTEAIFRTKNNDYWPADQKVTFTAHLAGVKVGQSYGVADVTHQFRIGDKHILKVSATSDQAVAYQNDVRVKSWPVSLGSSAHSTWITTSGIHLTMNHQNPVLMTSEWMHIDPKDTAHGGYSEEVPWATQITNSGEYVHQNMDDPSCLGNRNCSHGCVRSTPAGAQWFYHWSYLGDVVIISGTSNTLAWDNGWGYYQKSWSSWLNGSATGHSVMTDGSLPGAPASSSGTGGTAGTPSN
jgi:lipoprotein-anchoring transpeptidase ErfK/SrfK